MPGRDRPVRRLDAVLLWLFQREGWFPARAPHEAIEAVPSPKVRASMQKVLAETALPAG